jgi:hypothetical protein
VRPPAGDAGGAVRHTGRGVLRLLRRVRSLRQAVRRQAGGRLAGVLRDAPGAGAREPGAGVGVRGRGVRADVVHPLMLRWFECPCCT